MDKPSGKEACKTQTRIFTGKECMMGGANDATLSTGSPNTRAIRKVVFVAPRFHTNQAEFVRFLLSRSIAVAFLVAEMGKTEVYTDLTPHRLDLVNSSSIRRRTRDFIKNPYMHLYRSGILTVSSIRCVFQARPDIAIIRMPVSCVGGMSAILFRLTGARIVFYTQNPLHRPRRPLKDAILNLYAAVFNATWITPCMGDSCDPMPQRRSRFLPFTAYPKRYRKQWFIDGKVAILMIAKFLPRKRHDLLLDALEQLSDRFDFRVTMVGEVSEVTGDAVHKATAERAKSLPFEVDVMTNLPYEGVQDIYKSHDLFVLPSENDPASVSNLEAMSFGLPVVVSSCNRTAGYAGKAGWIFESKSTGDLVRVLAEAMSDREALKRRGAQSWAQVESAFMPDQVYGDFLDDL